MKGLLGLLLLLCVAPNSFTVPIAPLHNTELHNRVPGEWILLLRKDTVNSVTQTAKHIADTYGSSVCIQDTYQIGRLQAIRIHTDDATVHQLRHHREIMLIHSNSYVFAAASGKCQEQKTGNLFNRMGLFYCYIL